LTLPALVADCEKTAASAADCIASRREQSEPGLIAGVIRTFEAVMEAIA
jgi:hypothetical protein